MVAIIVITFAKLDFNLILNLPVLVWREQTSAVWFDASFSTSMDSNI